MDNEELSEPAESEENDDTTPVATEKTDYGTSAREEDEKPRIEFPSCRLVLYVMMFFGFAVAYALRASLSETIVAMVNQTAVNEGTETANSTECPRDPELEEEEGELVWNRIEQGIVLAAFYYGYLCTQVCSTRIRLRHILYQRSV